jgi:hypothetical protein
LDRSVGEKNKLFGFAMGGCCLSVAVKDSRDDRVVAVCAVWRSFAAFAWRRRFLELPKEGQFLRWLV